MSGSEDGNIKATGKRIGEWLDAVLPADLEGRDEAIAFCKIAGVKIETLDYEWGSDLDWEWPLCADDEKNYGHILRPPAPPTAGTGPSYRDFLLSLSRTIKP